MQMQLHRVLASLADRAVRQAHFGTLHRVTGFAQAFDDVAVADRAEQLAFATGLGRERELEAFELGRARLRAAQLVLRDLFELGATGFERGDVFRRRHRGLALGQQVIAAVAGLDLDAIADVAEVGNPLLENEFHDFAPFRSNRSSNTKYSHTALAPFARLGPSQLSAKPQIATM